MFEIFRRQEEMNYIINLKSVYFVVLSYIIASQCTVQKAFLKKSARRCIGNEHTLVISEVLHTVCFLFKNEFTLQNTFTGLQCNFHCALSQRSNVWVSLVFLSGCLRF
jgi:hypothetical protein